MVEKIEGLPLCPHLASPGVPAPPAPPPPTVIGKAVAVTVTLFPGVG
jgi:hypothetical protein